MALSTVFWLASAAIVAAVILGGWWVVLLQGQPAGHSGRALQHLEHVLATRVVPAQEKKSADMAAWREHWEAQSGDWLDRPWGKQLLAEEDAALLVQSGFSSAFSRLGFVAARVGLAVLLPLATAIATVWWTPAGMRWPWIFAALAVGYLLPKWALRWRASQRRKQAQAELPLLLDLLGLLQGAGQGLDQSLQWLADNFQEVMPVLGSELAVVNRLYASGRTREQAFRRLSEMFHSESLADLAALLVQIDRHGGAVQEPLRRFGDRLREQRRMRMKEEIGKTTVKMTAVMVLTLLPALMIVTAGPGFLGVLRALGGS